MSRVHAAMKFDVFASVVVSETLELTMMTADKVANGMMFLLLHCASFVKSSFDLSDQTC